MNKNEKISMIILAVVFFVTLGTLHLNVWFYTPDTKQEVIQTEAHPLTPDPIAAIISECTVGAIDASDKPLFIIAGDAKREKRDAQDAFWVLASATALQERLNPENTTGKTHLENIHGLYRAHSIEFKKPRPDLDRARRVRQFMDAELKKLEASLQ